MISRLIDYRCLIIVLFIGSLISFGAVAEEECLANAWRAFNANRHSEAVGFANECISNFETQARRQQSSVRSAPPCGKVSDQQTASIHQRGLLNDVATAAWIKAKSAKALGNTEVSTQAMSLVCELKHGRTWDPKGWFWAPCEGACP